MSLFDVCILNPDSDSLRGQALSTIFETRRNKKKATYSEAAESTADNKYISVNI